jgi:hypothetical protein
MSDPKELPAIAQSPITVILLAQALCTETQDALHGWRNYLDTLNRPHEIILLQETRSEVPPAATEPVPSAVQPSRTIPYDRLLGHRETLNEAICTAQHPLIVFCPCDKQYQPDDLERMLKMIDQVHLVVGYRVGKPIPFWRVLFDTLLIPLSRVFIGVPIAPTACWLGSQGWGRRFIARWVFGVRLNDPECPFRLARKEMFARIPIQSKGSFAQIEMLAKANHLTCLIAEEAVTWLPAALPASEAIPFSNDAWHVFRDPEFGR